MVGNHVIKIQPQNHPYGEVESYFLAQLPLGANAEAVANDKHPDQQLGIDRRSADGAGEWTQLFVQVAEHRCHENIHPAQQVPLRDHVIEPKFVEKVRLLSILFVPSSPNHPTLIQSQESSFSPSRKPFFDSIGPKRTIWRADLWLCRRCSAVSKFPKTSSRNEWIRLPPAIILLLGGHAIRCRAVIGTHEALRLLVGQTLLDAAPAIQRPVVARSRFR